MRIPTHPTANHPPNYRRRERTEQKRHSTSPMCIHNPLAPERFTQACENVLPNISVWDPSARHQTYPCNPPCLLSHLKIQTSYQISTECFIKYRFPLFIVSKNVLITFAFLIFVLHKRLQIRLLHFIKDFSLEKKIIVKELVNRIIFFWGHFCM